MATERETVEDSKAGEERKEAQELINNNTAVIGATMGFRRLPRSIKNMNLVLKSNSSTVSYMEIIIIAKL